MSIPSFDLTDLTDEKGKLTPKAKLFFDQLTTILQNNLSPQGFKLPKLDATTIAQLNTAISTGAIVYNTTTNKAMVCENGSFKTITTS